MIKDIDPSGVDGGAYDPLSDERLAEMLAGLEGVTPGPWVPAELGTYPDDEGAKVLGPQEYNRAGHPVRYFVAQFMQEKNAAHIARCDSDTIGALITEVQAARRSGNGGDVNESALDEFRRNLAAAQTATEPEFAEALAKNRTELYLRSTPLHPDQVGEDNWQDIATAPQSGDYILVWSPKAFLSGHRFMAKWNADKHASKPRPFWDFVGQPISSSRQNPPTHWRPLPAPPASQGAGE